MASEAGLVKLGHVAIDGTKLKANASKHSAMSYGRMKIEEQQLAREVDAFLEQTAANDAVEDKVYGSESGWRLPTELKDRRKRLEAIRRAKERLEAEAKEKLAADPGRQAEEGRAGRVGIHAPENAEDAKPKDTDQMNFTDPDSRIMLNADKAFVQAYNGQVAVDADSHVILAVDLTGQADDGSHLLSMVRQVRENTGRYPSELSLDAGYFSEANLLGLGEGVEALIPPDKVKHSEWREHPPATGEPPIEATLRERMRHKLRTEHGRERYKLRMTSVGPVFGYIKEAMRFRQLVLRGEGKARSLWRLQCTAFNVMKLYWKAREVRLALMNMS